MKPEEQRIAIAEACGWTITVAARHGFPTHLGILKNPDGRIVSTWHGENIKTIRDYTKACPEGNCIPDYLHDLNAMNEAENRLFPVDVSRLYGPDRWTVY